MNSTRLLAGIAIGAALAFVPFALRAADLPKSTQKMLEDLKLVGDPIVTDLNEEATNMPASVVEAAKKEGVVDYSGSIDPKDFDKMTAPFRERFPFIKIRYSSGDQTNRNIKPLVAYKTGNVQVDIVDGLGVNLSDYTSIGAVQKLTDLPNIKTIPENIRDPNGFWVGPRLQYWCMTYNTNNIKESELPKTWDDLLTDPSMRGGRLGIINRPNNFMIMLWGNKGPAWSENFMDKLFNDVFPQFRKEASDTAVDLVGAGEMDVAFPTAGYRTYASQQKGAPVSWHCPTPVPLSFSALVLMNKSPHSNAAKLYINWYLSKEGQISQYYGDKSPPTHKDLQDPRFVVYSDQIVGKPLAIRYPKLLEEDMSKVAAMWDDKWQKASARRR
jgi:ABC-type Fe3+ transport system substrate-binding protein